MTANNVNLADRQRLYDAGLNDSEIGEALGLRKGTIAHWRKVRGLPVNYRATDERPKRRTPSWTHYSKPGKEVSIDTTFLTGMHNYIADDKWSDWLYEMGATVWQ